MKAGPGAVGRFALVDSLVGFGPHVDISERHYLRGEDMDE